MKIRGGYLPRIAGEPAKSVGKVLVPGELRLSLSRHGVLYTSLCEDGARVVAGAPVAEAKIPGGILHMPAPASGVVLLHIPEGGDAPDAMVIKVTGGRSDEPATGFKKPDLQSGRSDAGAVIRTALARGGVWPLFWSSATRGIPSLDPGEKPQVILVNSILSEPFRPAGEVVLQHWKDRVERGLHFLQDLLAAGGSICVIHDGGGNDAMAGMRRHHEGMDHVFFHTAPVRYPVENPAILCKALRASNKVLGSKDTAWVIDLQGVAAVGACLGEGEPLRQRLVAVGGPAHGSPGHVLATIGTPVASLAGRGAKEGTVVLRGGLFKGVPADPARDGLSYDDDAFFCLAETSAREFLGFIAPGFNRRSIFPSFASLLTGAPDCHVSATLRGEHRPCIACGMCEEICPAGLMPQVLHRLLFAESFEEMEKMGLNLCVECGLCSYVCPSKVELAAQFAETRRRLEKEKEDAARHDAQ